MQVILLEEQKGIVAKESVPSKNSKGKRFYQLVVNILNLKGLKILNVYKRSLFIKINIKGKINDLESCTSGNFYYVQPLSLYLSTSAILTDNYYSLFLCKLANVLFNWLIDNYLD